MFLSLPASASVVQSRMHSVPISFSFSAATDVQKPVMSVSIDEGTPVYIHKNKIFDCSGSNNHGGGCTRVLFYAMVTGLELNSNGSIGKISLKIGLSKVEVEISSELKKGSCLFDAVLKHELTHLALHRRILNKFAPQIAAAIMTLIESMTSEPFNHSQASKINQVLNRFVNQMMQEDQKQNALMDSQGAYWHLQKQCLR